MTERILQHGDIVTVAFPEQIPQAREQEGYRPAIIVGMPERLGIPRFRLVIVAGLFHSKNAFEGIEAKFAETLSLSHIGELVGAIEINREVTSDGEDLR